MLKEGMDSGEKRCRLVGDYILGPKIGCGSFAVVWRSRHRSLGHEVAIKEIDKKQLSSTSNSSKINDSLLKEISILSRIRHPNIVRLHEAIETADKIFLVLECCIGGDLAAYIQRFGRVSEAVARHFMRQLVSGLQVLRENNLIHRDLKPQNLLLSTKDETPILKIGDFGFARYLTPQGLADTLCGSPLYMAPEIIQNKKYDAKADLWSVGAIFFQLVTGRPPFDGNNQFQLFQNILKSNELQFPQGVMEELHPDCIDLCKSLLRRNPVERLTFEEFFNHKFMADPRPTVGVEYSSLLLERIPDEQGEGLTDDKLPLTFDKRPQLHSSLLSHVSGRYPELVSSTPSSDENVLTERGQSRNDRDDKASTSGDRGGVHKCMLAFQDESLSKSIDCSSSKISDQGSMKTGSVEQGILSMSTMKAKGILYLTHEEIFCHMCPVADSLELIEREYVVVNAHFALTGSLSSSLEASVRDSSEAQSSNHPLKTTDESVGASVPIRTRELYLDSICGVESLGSNKSVPLAASQASTKSIDVQDSSSLNPSTRLQSLRQYVLVLSELAQEKLNAQMPLEAFSIELVALALWKEALHVCSCWVTHCADREPLRSSSDECPPNQENTYLSLNLAENVDFNSPASVFSWAEHGFIVSFDRAEKISKYLQEMDGGAEMPDAMDIIFQTALAAGKNGAVDELMGNRSSAAALYSKATILLSFILAEASSLPLKPPFSLNVSDQQRIHRYILNLKAHLSNQKCYTHLHFKAP